MPPSCSVRSSFGFGRLPGRHESEDTGFARRKIHRQIPSTPRLTPKPVVPLSLPADHRVAEDDVTNLIDRHMMPSDVVISIRFDDQIVDPHPFGPSTASLTDAAFPAWKYPTPG